MQRKRREKHNGGAGKYLTDNFGYVHNIWFSCYLVVIIFRHF
jgi:hypothetical protein